MGYRQAMDAKNFIIDFMKLLFRRIFDRFLCNNVDEIQTRKPFNNNDKIRWAENKAFAWISFNKNVFVYSVHSSFIYFQPHQHQYTNT